MSAVTHARSSSTSTASTGSVSVPAPAVVSRYDLGRELSACLHRPGTLRRVALSFAYAQVMELGALVAWSVLMAHSTGLPLVIYVQFLLVRCVALTVLDWQAARCPSLYVTQEDAQGEHGAESEAATLERGGSGSASVSHPRTSRSAIEALLPATLPALRRRHRFVRAVFAVCHLCFTVAIIVVATRTPRDFLAAVPVLAYQLAHLIGAGGLWCVLLLLWPARNLSCFVPFVPITQAELDLQAKEWRKAQATVQAIATLPEVQFAMWHASDHSQAAFSQSQEQSACAVCCAEFEGAHRCRELKCGHLFHTHCIDEWLRRKNACPLCVRAPIDEPTLSL